MPTMEAREDSFWKLSLPKSNCELRRRIPFLTVRSMRVRMGGTADFCCACTGLRFFKLCFFNRLLEFLDAYPVLTEFVMLRVPVIPEALEDPVM